MNERELIRHALMGDKQAQKECTEKEIMLPCPKCFSDDVKIEGDGHNIYDPTTLGYLGSVPDSRLYITCNNCDACASFVEIKEDEYYEDAEKRLIADWNTRPTPPIGRCGECKHFTSFFNELGYCKVLSQEKDLDGDGYHVEMLKTDFCSYFEPREE